MPSSRRGVAARAVAVALIIAAVGVVVVTSRSRSTPPFQAVGAHASSSSTSSTSSSTSTSTTAVPTTTVSPTSTGAPPTTTTAPRQRTRTLRTESGSITFDVTIEPAYPRTGEVVEFRIDATDREGGLFYFGLNTGDEAPRRPSRPTLSCTTPHPDAAQEGAPPRSPQSSSDSMVYRHSYRVAADRHVEIHVGTVACFRQAHDADARTLITVLPGEARSNGPQPPTAWVLQNPHEDRTPEHVLLSFGGTDADGYVRRFTVNWGDGSAPMVIDAPTSSCTDPQDAYPSSAADHAREHVYAPGRYVATVTIVSTGCDGQHSQTATASTDINLDG